MPPVFTPLTSHYAINYDVIPDYAQYLSNAGFKTILVGGTTGENMCLNVEDRKKLMAVWKNEADKYKINICAQVGGAPLPDVLELASYAQSLKVDSIMTLPELYFKPKNAYELGFYVKQVAEAASKLPILYYHIPSFTNVEVNMVEFVNLANITIPTFRGLKFTSNDLCEAAHVHKSLNPNQNMYLGADTLLAPARILGIKSVIGTTLNFMPLVAEKISFAIDGGDINTARLQQKILTAAVEAITNEGDWVPAMKATMSMVSGIEMGPPCLPQKEISGGARLKIKESMRELGLL